MDQCFEDDETVDADVEGVHDADEKFEALEEVAEAIDEAVEDVLDAAELSVAESFEAEIEIH